MMTCREVSTLVSTGSLDAAPWSTRLAAWVHLAMCRHCKAFRRQLDSIGRAARTASRALDAELAPGYEARVTAALARKPPRC